MLHCQVNFTRACPIMVSPEESPLMLNCFSRCLALHTALDPFAGSRLDQHQPDLANSYRPARAASACRAAGGLAAEAPGTGLSDGPYRLDGEQHVQLQTAQLLLPDGCGALGVLAVQACELQAMGCWDAPAGLEQTAAQRPSAHMSSAATRSTTPASELVTGPVQLAENTPPWLHAQVEAAPELTPSLQAAVGACLQPWLEGRLEVVVGLAVQEEVQSSVRALLNDFINC
jgi:hypothetical protein